MGVGGRRVKDSLAEAKAEEKRPRSPTQIRFQERGLEGKGRWARKTRKTRSRAANGGGAKAHPPASHLGQGGRGCSAA